MRNVVELLPRMTVSQTLTGAIEELIATVTELKKQFPTLTDDKAIEIVLELKKLGQPREV